MSPGPRSLPWSLVPGLFWGKAVPSVSGPRSFPGQRSVSLVLPLVLSKVLSQVLLGGRVVSQSGPRTGVPLPIPLTPHPLPPSPPPVTGQGVPPPSKTWDRTSDRTSEGSRGTPLPPPFPFPRTPHATDRICCGRYASFGHAG